MNEKKCWLCGSKVEVEGKGKGISKYDGLHQCDACYYRSERICEERLETASDNADEIRFGG